MTVIAHISDLHVCKADFDEDMFMKAVSEINALQPDMIIFMCLSKSEMKCLGYG